MGTTSTTFDHDLQHVGGQRQLAEHRGRARGERDRRDLHQRQPGQHGDRTGRRPGLGITIYLGADEQAARRWLQFQWTDRERGPVQHRPDFGERPEHPQGTITPQTTDQRGDPRIYNGAIDIGAVEEQPYEVINTNDSGPGSLRQEIADDAAGDQPVTFSPSLDGQTITLTSGPITDQEQHGDRRARRRRADDQRWWNPARSSSSIPGTCRSPA